MIWYVAVIAILNLGLGYALAVYLGAGRNRSAAPGAGSFDDTEYSTVEDAA
jgi:hypothetical protein